MLDSLIHGEDLFEILIEGANPYADGPLKQGERALLHENGMDPDALDALLIGRVVKGGRGLWALSPSQLLLLGQRHRDSVDRVARTDIIHAESETGRYGQTVRLHSAQGRWAMYGVDPARAARLLQQLSRSPSPA